MRTAIFWLAGSVVLIGLLWLIRVPPYDVAQSKRVKADTLSRLAIERSRPAEDNGYVDLVAFTEEPFAALWAALEGHWQLEDDERRADLVKFSREIERNVALLEQVLPRLEGAVQKPYISWDEELQSCRILSLRAIGYALLEDGLWWETHGRSDTAVNRYVLAIRYGTLLRRNREGVFGNYLVDSGSQALQSLLSRVTLPRPTLQAVADALDATPLYNSDLVQVADARYIQDLDPRMEPSGDWSYNALSASKGVLTVLLPSLDGGLRDWFYLRYRPCLVDLRSPEDLGLDEDEDMAYLAQRWSLAAIQEQSFMRHMEIIFCRAQSEAGAARLTVAICAYRQDHGVWPVALDCLVPSYLQTVPPDVMGSSRQYRYDVTPTGVRLYSHSMHQRMGWLSRNSDQAFFPWHEETP